MIFSFETPLSYLKFLFEGKKASNEKYSLTKFAKDLGLSKSYICHIFKEEIILSPKKGTQLASTLNLDKLEEQYLQLMISLANAEDENTKSEILKKMDRLKITYNKKYIDYRMYEVISNWEVSRFLETLNLDHIDTSVENLRRVSEMSHDSFNQMVTTLQYFKLIQVDEKNKIKRLDNGMVYTMNDIVNKALREFHEGILHSAAKAIKVQATEKRNFNGITMAIDEKKLPEAKRMIRDFINQLSVFLEQGSKNKVYQLEVALFDLYKLD